jgi:molybdenum cofactor cytidylyltransferase
MIAALILAAGSSRRMGRPKQLLEIGGEALIRRAVHQAEAAGLEQIFVVVGPHRAEIERALAGTAARLVDNLDHLTGMASSLRAGLGALGPEAEAAIVMLADQPFQNADILRRLIAAYRASGQPIVVPLYAGRRGNPVLFDRALFAELAAQEGDRGGRDVLLAHPQQVEAVEFDRPELQTDLDTWEQYLAARAVLDGP